MVDPSRIELCTFDCYGTLINWEAGIRQALRPVLNAHGVSVDDGTIVQRYGALEAEAEAKPYRPYREVLQEVVRRLGAELGFDPTAAETGCLAISLPHWQPFADVADALRRLKTRYRLAIVSNIDDALLSQSLAHLPVSFDWTITAEQVRSYKPNRAHFDFVPQVTGIPKQQTLHVAQSIFHDVLPAKALGWTVAWINRSGENIGVGRDVRGDARPDIEAPSLGALADMLCSSHR